METRISKYAAYRADIINSGLIADKVLVDSSITNEYKSKIDKINPVILENLKYSLSFGKLVSVNQKNTKDIENLENIVKQINEKDLVTTLDKIEKWSNKNKVKSIISEDNRVAASWLDEDDNYQKISNNRQRLEILRNNWATFQVTSREQITKLDQLAKSQEILNTFKNLEIQKKQIYPNSSSLKKIGTISLICTILFIAIAVAIVIVAKFFIGQ